MKALHVDLAERSYPIYIGKGLLADCQRLLADKLNTQVMIISNTTIAPLYLDQLKQALSGYHLHSFIIADGEKYKTVDTYTDIITELLHRRLHRQCTLIALGGGVVGDISGFVAATYQRGVGYIQVPTTLLAQVDSSVGGKTAVNHALGKNMIGAFYQPQAVLADIGVLDTLPGREFNAGLAEVIKYGCINDADFFAWLMDNVAAMQQGEPEAIAVAVERSCRNKAEVVAQDETERGVRAILNLGHTFGHAIETAQAYQDCLHGEAVAIGMAMAADLSVRVGRLAEADKERIHQLLRLAGLPVQLPCNVTAATLGSHMAMDKKVKDGRLNLVLLDAIGHAVVTADVAESQLMATINAFMPSRASA